MIIKRNEIEKWILEEENSSLKEKYEYQKEMQLPDSKDTEKEAGSSGNSVSEEKNELKNPGIENLVVNGNKRMRDFGGKKCADVEEMKKGIANVKILEDKQESKEEFGKMPDISGYDKHRRKLGKEFPGPYKVVKYKGKEHNKSTNLDTII